MLFRRKANAITPANAAERGARGELQLVDVREPAELAQARVPVATDSKEST